VLKQILSMCSLFALLVAAVPTPSFAHHAFAAEFDVAKPVTLTGVITRVDWINPHAYVYLDVKDANGAVVKWSLETLPPLMARKGGMTKDMLPVGQTITIGGFGSKDGSKMAWIKKITFADGKVLQVTAEDNQEASQK